MTPKRVLFLSYNGLLEPIFRSQGLAYLKELSKKGTEIILLTFEKKGDLRNAGKAGLLAFRQELKKENIVWHFALYHKRPPIFSTLYDLCIGFWRAWFLARRHSVNLIHARGSIPAGFGWPVARVLKKPFLFDMRGFLAEEYADGGLWKRNGLIFRLVSRFERRLLKSADWIVVLTGRASRYLRKRTLVPEGTPVTVIPCCVDFRRFHGAKGPRSKEFVLTYIGSLGTWYLLDEMFAFYQVMKKKIPKSSFRLFTQTHDRFLTEKLRRFSGGGLLCREIGYEEVPKALSETHAGVSFIKPVFSKMASSPTKVGEYLASGIPVVLNADVGDTESLIRENRVGVVVDRFNRDSYEKAAVELEELLKEGESLSARCRRVAETHLSLEEGVKRYHEIYETLSGGIA